MPPSTGSTRTSRSSTRCAVGTPTVGRGGIATAAAAVHARRGRSSTFGRSGRLGVGTRVVTCVCSRQSEFLRGAAGSRGDASSRRAAATEPLWLLRVRAL
eukprot:4813168-Prymnesium_polylepis.1